MESRSIIDDGYGLEPKPPKGVSVQEFVDYFGREFEEAYEAQYEKEQDEQ